MAVVCGGTTLIFYRTTETEPKYYADGEDAYAMRRDLVDWARQEGISAPHPGKFFHADRKHRRQGREALKNAVTAVDAAATGLDSLAIADAAAPVAEEKEAAANLPTEKKGNESKDIAADTAEQSAGGKKNKHRRK